jgi:signal transduction histidine kinase
MSDRAQGRRLFSSLRTRVLLLIALAIVPLVALQLITAQQQRETVSRQLQNDALRLTRLVAGNQTEYFDFTRQLLLTLSQMPAVREGNLEDCNSLFAEILQQFPLYTNVYTVSANGDNQCSGLPNEPGTTNVTERQWFQTARSRPGYVMGNYTIGVLTTQPVVPNAVSMFNDEGEFIGAVAAGLSLSWLNSFLQDTALPPGGILAMLDKQGTVLAVYPEDAIPEAVGQNAADNPLFQIIAANQEGSTRLESEAGEGFVLGYTSLGDEVSGVYVVLVVPEAQSFAEVNEVQNRSLALLGMTSLAVFVIAAFGSQRLLLQPIHNLIEASNQLGQGDLSARAQGQSGIAELESLAASFNTMADKLQRRENQLEESNHQLENSLIELGQEIEERRKTEDELKRFTQQLENSNQELEQFAYVASHDLQEPLRVVAGYLQLLERRYKGRLDSDADEFIAFAVDAAKRMQNLINDLLAYSRIGRKIRPFEATDASRIVAEAKRNLAMLIEETKAEVVAGELPQIWGDAAQLVLVFQNLISNGIKFHSDVSPRIDINAKDCGEMWEFSVRDNGIGIDPQYSKRIFLIFQRLHTREEYPGTGIGLAICQKIVEYHGGKIWVESEEGKGTTFHFTLPKQQTQEA